MTKTFITRMQLTL